MAFETLRPHQAQILALIDQGRTLAQVAGALETLHGVKTTPATLSRFLNDLRPAKTKSIVPTASPEPIPSVSASVPNPPMHVPLVAPPEHTQLLRAILAEVQASRDENHSIQEVIAGKVAALSADVVELERATVAIRTQVENLPPPTVIAPPAAMPQPVGVKPGTMKGIWANALLITFLLWGGLIGGIVVVLSGD